jgi:two-component system cell cycle sensor histidine kinase/response regulator CckA
MSYAGLLSRPIVSARTRFVLAAAPLFGYILLFFMVFFASAAGPSVIYLSGVGVAVAAWLLGRWAGLVSGLLALPLNFALLWAAGVGVDDAAMFAGNSAICAANLSMGWVVGWMGELHRRAQAQAAELARDHEILTHAIAERERVEGRLRESEELFRLITESAADMIALGDPSGKLVYCSPAYQRTLGQAPPATLQDVQATQLHPDDAAAAGAALERVRAGVRELLTIRVRHADGSWRWVEASGTFVPWHGSRYLLGVARDVTARRHAQDELQRSHEHYQALVDSVEGIVWERALPEFGFTRVSHYAERLLGYPVRCWTDDASFWPSHLHPDDRAEAVRQCQAVAVTLCSHELVYRMRAADGRFVWLRDLVKVVVEQGRAVKLRGIMLDITRQRQVEAALREGQALTRRVLESVPAGIIMVAPDGRIVEANGHARRYLGLSDERLEGLYVKDYEQHTIWEDGSACPPEEYPVSKCLRTGLPKPAVTIGVRFADGRIFWGLFSATPAAADPQTGRPTGAVVTFLDITERRELEQQLRQAQKMDAVGRLAGGVAHDFNNLLTVINGYGELLLDSLPTGTPAHGLASEIIKAAERAAGLTRQLLAFGRKQVVALQALDLNAVIDAMRGLLARVLGEDIELDVRLSTETLAVKADPTQIEQIVLNLAVNARDAMPEGGKLSIATATVGISELATRPSTSVQAGVFVLLEMGDNGVGMTEEVRSRLFEPFFTTKEVGKGTGLGLATVYGIVKQFGGHIEVQTAAGQGTTFRVYFPHSAEPLREAKAAPQSPPPRGGDEVILVAEDEPLVRSLTVRCLRMAGYHVLEAPSAPEAALICERHDGPIHLLLTDVVMPQLSGQALARQVQAHRAGIKVLFMSGHIDDAVLKLGIRDEGVPFLPKPFTPDALVRKVREVLDG